MNQRPHYGSWCNGEGLGYWAAQNTTRTMGAIDFDLESARSERFAAIMGHLEQLTDVDHTLDSVPLAINYLWSRGDLEFKRLAVGCALGLDSVELARGLLDSLPLTTKEDSTFYDYHDLLITLREGNKTILDLKGPELDPIHDLAYSESSLNAMAEAILALHADSAIIRWHEELPDERRGQHAQSAPLAIPIAEAKVTVYPNPAMNQFVVKYALGKEARLLVAEVFDVTGRSVYTKSLNATQNGELNIELAPCSGVYSVRLMADGLPVSFTKLICFDRK